MRTGVSAFRLGEAKGAWRDGGVPVMLYSFDTHYAGCASRKYQVDQGRSARAFPGFGLCNGADRAAFANIGRPLFAE